ncbi:MAG: hypothetical protein V4805_16915 [Pseudomonadota bacterium]
MSINFKNSWKKQLSIFLALPMLSFAGFAYGNAVTNANVVAVGSYGDGSINVILDATVLEAGCNAARFDIPANHPNLKSILAMALTAKSAGTPLRIFTTGCITTTFQSGTNSFPTIDTTSNGAVSVR